METNIIEAETRTRAEQKQAEFFEKAALALDSNIYFQVRDQEGVFSTSM